MTDQMVGLLAETRRLERPETRMLSILWVLT
jgi:hypothetical protein